jgi:hypothetical protein
MGKYTQEFTLHYQADPDGVWASLQKAIDNMDGARLGEKVHAITIEHRLDKGIRAQLG